jgi:alpha-N-arabinofuranosidase
MFAVFANMGCIDGMQVVPAQTMLENADKDIDVVLSPYSLTSLDLLTESNNIRTPQIDSFSRSSN